MDLSHAFGVIVRMNREQAGLTQQELADLADLHFTAISKIERGMKWPRLDTIEALAAALEVPVGELVRQADELRKIPKSSPRPRRD